MERITIAEVEKIGDNMPIDKMIVGTIGFIKAQEEKTIKPKDGQPILKKVQGFAVKDDTGSIWIEMDDHAEILREQQGKTISIYGWLNDKKEWKGVKKGESWLDKEKVKKHKIHVTKTGNVKIEGTKEESKKEEVKDNKPSEQKSETVVESSKGEQSALTREVKINLEKQIEKRIANKSMVTIAIIKEVLEGNTAKGKISLAGVPALVNACMDLIYGVELGKSINDFTVLNAVPFGGEGE